MLARIKLPHTAVLIFGVLIFVAGLTWVVPGGAFERAVDEAGRTVVVPGTYERVESEPQGLGAILTAPLAGFVGAAEIIGFVLFIGGVFGILQTSGAIEAALRSVVAAHERSAAVRAALIPLMMAAFSLGGAVFGMSEETIPFVLIFVPLALALGYDSIVGVCIPFVGAGAGFAGAFFNPFTVGIAQGIAGLPPFSGVAFRLVVWVCTTALAVGFVMWYAARIRRDPARSPVYEEDQAKRAELHVEETEHAGMTGRHQAVLAVFALGMALLVWGVTQYGWYISEIAALFIGTGIVMGVAARMGVDEAVAAFMDGVRALAETALIIGLAKGILVIAEDGQIIDTILVAMAGLVEGAHPALSANAMFAVQSALNILVPSGSGQAALTMPIMAPLADLVGLSRQTAVLAYQLGDGFTNLITPTSPVLMGVLTLAGIPWARWARFMLPLQALFVVLGALLLTAAVLIGWS